MKVKDYKLDNGKEHLFGVLKKETGTIKYVYEYSHQIPLAMGCYTIGDGMLSEGFLQKRQQIQDSEVSYYRCGVSHPKGSQAMTKPNPFIKQSLVRLTA
jgi:hypothetical protein